MCRAWQRKKDLEENQTYSKILLAVKSLLPESVADPGWLSRILIFFSSCQKYGSWIQDPGSRKKLSGSRSQKKKTPDPDPQHCPDNVQIADATVSCTIAFFNVDLLYLLSFF
jgi:hypothetical protein